MPCVPSAQVIHDRLGRGAVVKDRLAKVHPSLLRASIVLGDLVTLTVVLVVGFLLLMYFSAHSAWQRTSWLPLKTEATFHCHD